MAEQSIRNGDGRVPLISACCYFDKVQTLLLSDSFLYRDYSHSTLLKDERVQKLVNRFLFGETGFSYHFSGRSIRRVIDIVEKYDEKSGLPYWDVRTD
ncbi:MAG: hypothetical protein IIA61_05560 [Candidatus Marinimicrobia bacterium]|nr:hypothetical protein [Candidatus Neomarinimicrobiota bacterium]